MAAEFDPAEPFFTPLIISISPVGRISISLIRRGPGMFSIFHSCLFPVNRKIPQWLNIKNWTIPIDSAHVLRWRLKSKNSIPVISILPHDVNAGKNLPCWAAENASEAAPPHIMTSTLSKRSEWLKGRMTDEPVLG